MKAYLIYESNAAAKNKGLIDIFIKEGKDIGVEIDLLFSEKLSYGIRNNILFASYENIPLMMPDFIICRIINPLLSRHFELMGIPVFNNSVVADICNNKLKTHQYLSRTGIRMTDTFFITKKERLKYNSEGLTYPSVVKSACGHGGESVFLVNNSLELYEAINMIDDDIAIQRPVTELGKDMRVYVVGKNIVAAVLRESHSDFRSNYSLGGKATLKELSTDEINIVNNIIEVFDFGMVGIDFIFDNGKMLFNEIEDVVGSRMLYAKSDMNIAKTYLKHIIKTLKQ